MVAVAEPTATSAPSPSRWGRLMRLLRAHRVFAITFGVAALLRIITMLGFGPAMWFNDSYEYISNALHPGRPDPIRPNGYGFWLVLFRPFHSLSLVVLSQHLMGLATATLIYVLL